MTSSIERYANHTTMSDTTMSDYTLVVEIEINDLGIACMVGRIATLLGIALQQLHCSTRCCSIGNHRHSWRRCIILSTTSSSSYC